MNKSISRVAIAVASIFSLQAQADGDVSSGSIASDKFYVSGSYGEAMNKTKPSYEDYKSGKTPTRASVFGMGVGYKLNENFRSELKCMHFGASKYESVDTDLNDDVAKHNVQSKGLFANLYYDFNNFGEKFTPYITSGIGYAKNKASDAKTYDSDGAPTDEVYKGASKGSLAWNVGAGLSYKMNEKVTWDAVQYNYFNLGKYSTQRFDEDSGPLKGKIKVHTVTTGIRISF
jgi:opacity protein-like surface antigen